MNKQQQVYLNEQYIKELQTMYKHGKIVKTEAESDSSEEDSDQEQN